MLKAEKATMRDGKEGRRDKAPSPTAILQVQRSSSPQVDELRFLPELEKQEAEVEAVMLG